MRNGRFGLALWLLSSTLAAAQTATGASAGALRLRWTELAPGVFEARAGEPEPLTLLGAAAQAPKREALAALPRARFPFEPGEAVARVASGKVALRFPLAEDEEIYGLGVDFKSLRRTGATMRLHVDHWGGVPGRTHAPVPFYVSSRGYGVLVDSARYVDFYVGTGVRLAAPRKPPVVDRTTGGKAWSAQPRSDSVEALVPAPGVRVLLFEGATPLDAVRRYNLWSGGGALPPKWGLGFMTRTPTGYTAEQALAEVAEFRRRGIPLDMLGLEPGWHDHAYPCSFEWDKTRFPDPGGFLAELARNHVRANLWFNPYVSPTAPLHARLLPFAGSHLVWNGIVPDYSLAEARAVFSDHLKRTVVSLNPAAVGGFKVDEVDGYDRWLWPDLAVFPSGNGADQLRQSYGLLVQRLLFDLFRSENRRTLGQVRGTNAGASPFPFVIYNDNYAFDEYLTAVANSSFAGVLWSPEVRAGDAEDMLRRVQAVSFSPLALFNGWATSTKLWTHAAVEADIRAAIQLRMRLLPYWYTTFAQYHFEGTPVVRAMPLVAGFEARSGAPEARDQYMIGDALLVAPMAPGARTRKVLLPTGRWFDFATGRLAGEGPAEIEVAPGLSQIPLFVRDGSLVPLLAAERQWAPSPSEVLPLEVRHYGLAPGAIDLYDDDGESFDYERGELSRTRLAAVRDASGEWRGNVRPDANGSKWRYGDVTWRFMTAPEPAQAPTPEPPRADEAQQRAQEERRRSGDRRTRRVRMERVQVASPDGRVVFTLLPNPERLSFTVTIDGRTAIEPSPVQMSVDGFDLGTGLTLGQVESYAIDESYPWHGAHATAVNRCRGARVALVSDLGQVPYSFEVRAFDDGVAYRHVVPGAPDAARVPDERSAFVLPAGATVWYHDLDGHYESAYEERSAADVPAGQWAGPPLTFQLPQGGYGSITEANLVGYAGMALEADGRRGFVVGLGHRQPVNWPFELRYGRDEGKRLGGAAPVAGTITTPWRVVLLGRDLNALVNSDVLPSLCPPADARLFPQGLATPWVEPGLAVWRYVDGGEDSFEGLLRFSELGARLGAKYHIVEGVWQRWSDAQVRALVERSRELGVRLVFWKHSRQLRTPGEREAFFARLREGGVAGAKIDFFDHEGRETIDLYEELLRLAAENRLVLNFHGANKPTGRLRTWPHELVREAVRGMESRTLAERARHETILPFTRYLAGPADYTTMVFGERRADTTWAHQIASLATFQSPMLTIAAHPQSVLDNPALDVIRSIPPVWDETIVLPESRIGRLSVFARRKGEMWMLAVMAGGQAGALALPLAFLGEGRYDAALVRDVPGSAAAVTLETASVSRRESIKVVMPPGGGFVARFTR